MTPIAPVVNLNHRRTLPCPHCDQVMQIRYLIPHLEFHECPVLADKLPKQGA